MQELAIVNGKLEMSLQLHGC